MTTPLLVILAILLLMPAAIVIIVYAVKAFAFIIKRLGAFIIGMVGDALRLVGIVITVPILSLLVVANIVIGRWSAAGHFGRGVADEVRTFGAALYRLAIGHPARLLFLTPLTEGLERRLPDIVAAAPGPDKPRRRVGAFEGYEITGSLPGGGSGGKLYIATPDERKRGAFLRQGQGEVEHVVIKSFHLSEGSSLPQIVRESRSLESARKMGLVLEHELNDERFYYVMRYAPGDSLTRVTQQMHAMTGGQGLSQRDLRTALGYGRDLLDTLAAYHAGGLWHKDVKPDNIIVDGNRARLVDFGLITHLRSAMTLTTHGTEYFRDPEMVRMALRGVKVNEVDGERFDVYAAGAVLYSMVENSFPAHGGLSRISQPCPEAIRWIVRRAMADYDKRYRSAGEMLMDLDYVLRSEDMFAVKPAQLPSMGEGDAVQQAMESDPQPENAKAPEVAHVAHAATPKASPPPLPEEDKQPETPKSPRSKELNWWTGSFGIGGGAPKPAPEVPVDVGAPAPAFVNASTPKELRPHRSAREQVSAARTRAHDRRRRAHQRRTGLKGRPPTGPVGTRFGIGLAIILVVLPAIAAGLLTLRFAVLGDRHEGQRQMISAPEVPAPAAAPTLSFDAESPLQLASDLREAIRHTAAAQGGVEGSLLVVLDAKGLSLEARARLEHRLAALRAAGVHVLDAHPAAASEVEYITDQLAKLRRHLGMADPRTASGGQKLGQWIKNSGEVDAIYWIAPDEHDATSSTTITGSRGDIGEDIIKALRGLP
ncbi:MAG: serine/threonine protein kinase [Phycisphaerales bacterium]